MKKIALVAICAATTILSWSCLDDKHPTPGDSPISMNSISLVYSHDYTISLGGLEQYHPFDTAKYRKVYDHLIAANLIRSEEFIPPYPVTDAELLLVHTQEYLASLADPLVAAQIAGVTELSYVPSALISEGLYRPMRFACGGTILGARLALERGAAINLAGGYHHAKSASGGGFCYFSDIALAIKVLWQTKPNLSVLVIDVDAHQGNGYESIFADDKRISIFDMYNADIFPHDADAARFIDFSVKLRSKTTTDEYLAMLKEKLPQAIDTIKPDFILYNAGTDVYEGDPLGGLSVSTEGIIKRDEFTFSEARNRKIPILMVLSGGYTKESGQIIARSIENLLRK